MSSIAIEVKERPILFSAEMVRAILDGRKSQTRRVVKPQPTRFPDSCHDRPENWCYDTWNWSPIHQPATYATPDVLARELAERSPYGQPGELLWVREGFAYACSEDEASEPKKIVVYHADLTPEQEREGRWAVKTLRNLATVYSFNRWRPSIHMPRWASRITLEITEVRVERLQEISAQDALAEGITVSANSSEGDWSAVKAYAGLWDRINGKTHPWSANPWVWVVSFKRVNGLLTAEHGHDKSQAEVAK